MEETFKIPVIVQDQEILFRAELVIYGYSHRFRVDIEGVNVLFEPDEERKYRAILDNETLEKQLKPNVELVKLVGKKIEELFS